MNVKTIGLIGGMSWESTVSYYRGLNEAVRDRLGGLHSAKLVLVSVDFADIEVLQHRGDWDAAARILGAAAESLQNAGADFMLLCTNTMHKVAPQLERAVQLPLLHIADATATKLHEDGVARVALLGTRFTMEQPFYRERLERAGLEVLVPEPDERLRIHDVIYDELCRGIIEPDSRRAYLDIISSLAERGAQAVILGCTEIGLLVHPTDTHVPLYDTTSIHVDQAIELALACSGQE